MILRFFGFIWGAMLLTLILFAILINALELTVPESASRALEKDVVLRQLSHIAVSEGLEAALVTWRSLEGAHPDLVIARDPMCAAVVTIRDDQGKCLSVEQASTASTPLFWIEPFPLPLGLGAVISAIAAILLSRWLTKPIRTVNRGLKTLAAGELSTRIQPLLRTSNRDLSELAAAFDHAAARLQELTENRQRLFHDISHEIRSPLARLRAAIGLLEKNPARYESMLEQMATDIGRLDHLVGEILTLARFEKGQIDSRAENLDLVDIIEPILADANFEGQQRGVTVRYEGIEKMQLHADAELLHRAFENVIRNALAFSPEGGKVVVTGSFSAGKIILDVSDEGPGVAEADLKNLFTAFVQLGEEGRTRGVGLGLAIAASAIEAHAGEISAQGRPNGGLIVRMIIPVAQVLR